MKSDKSNFNDYILIYSYTIEDHMKLTHEHVFILVVIAATLIIIEVAPLKLCKTIPQAIILSHYH